MLISPVTSFASRIRTERNELKQQHGRYVVNGGDDWYFEPADQKKAEPPKTPQTPKPGKPDSPEKYIQDHLYSAEWRG